MFAYGLLILGNVGLAFYFIFRWLRSLIAEENFDFGWLLLFLLSSTNVMAWIYIIGEILK